MKDIKGTVQHMNDMMSLERNISVRLLAWYDKERRVLPWREDPTPYHVWVSEIMLQQTRVETVISYYERFLSELPDVQALANAKEERLLKLWEGLGYYSRVRNMKKAARQIMELYNGEIPSEPEKLVQLSGIGPYTAAAIASIAFGYPAVSVDGNLLRVYARLIAYREDIAAPGFKKAANNAYSDILPKDRPGDMNQALMDLGATICLPNGMPLCDKCPVCNFCAAHKSSLEAVIPKAKETQKRPVRKCTVLLIRQKNEVLLRRRPDKGLLAGLYEFPNPDGVLKKKDVLRLLESYGMKVCSIRTLPNARHVFSHLIWEMSGYEVFISGFDTGLKGALLPDRFFFISLDELKEKTALPSAFSVYCSILTNSKEL